MKVLCNLILFLIVFLFCSASLFAAKQVLDKSPQNVLLADIEEDEFLVVNVAIGAWTVFRFPEFPMHTDIDFKDGFENSLIPNTFDIGVRPIDDKPSNMYVWTASGRMFNFVLNIVGMGEHQRIVDLVSLVKNTPSYQKISLDQLRFVTKNYDNLGPEHERLKKRINQHIVKRNFHGKHLEALLKEIYVCKKPHYFITVFELKNISGQRIRILKTQNSYWFLRKRGGKLIKPDYRHIGKQIIKAGDSTELIGIFKYSQWGPKTVFDLHIFTDLYGKEILTMETLELEENISDAGKN